jgi:hypothetical protein
MRRQRFVQVRLRGFLLEGKRLIKAEIGSAECKGDTAVEKCGKLKSLPQNPVSNTALVEA